MLSTGHRICKCSRFSTSIVRFASETSKNKEEIPLIDTAFMKTTSVERILDRFHLHRWNLSSKSMYHGIAKFRKHKEIRQQKYDVDQVEMLGPNVSAMYVILRIGGVVKLVGHEELLTFSTANLSFTEKDPSLRVEAIDLRNIKFYYEGLEHLRNLPTLTWLNISGNCLVNNWYLDYLSTVAPNLEYLNISRCSNIDHNGLHCLYKFTKLKYLDVENVSDTLLFKGVCATIESEKPDLIIAGYVSNKVFRKNAFND